MLSLASFIRAYPLRNAQRKCHPKGEGTLALITIGGVYSSYPSGRGIGKLPVNEQFRTHRIID